MSRGELISFFEASVLLNVSLSQLEFLVDEGKLGRHLNDFGEKFINTDEIKEFFPNFRKLL